MLPIKKRPCPDCTVFHRDGQCVKCGWLKPWPGDAEIGLREFPLTEWEPCMLKSTHTEKPEVIEHDPA